MLEITARDHTEQTFRLEMIIAACMELIPNVPAYLERMIQKDAAGALRMAKRPSATQHSAYIQQPIKASTSQLSSSASYQQTCSLGSSSAAQEPSVFDTEGFNMYGEANFDTPSLLNPLLNEGLDM